MSFGQPWTLGGSLSMEWRENFGGEKIVRKIWRGKKRAGHNLISKFMLDVGLNWNALKIRVWFNVLTTYVKIGLKQWSVKQDACHYVITNFYFWAKERRERMIWKTLDNG
jgi:hypothetical protein